MQGFSEQDEHTCMPECESQNLRLINHHFTTLSGHCHRYLSQNWNSDGHFEMLNGSVILSVLELWHKTLKFLFLVFNDFVRKKKCESKKGFLSFMLQLRGLLWMVTCTEKRPLLRKNSKFSFLQSGQNKTRIYIQTIQEIWCSLGYNL